MERKNKTQKHDIPYCWPRPVPDEHQCTGQTKRRTNKNFRRLVQQWRKKQRVHEDGSGTYSPAEARPRPPPRNARVCSWLIFPGTVFPLEEQHLPFFVRCWQLRPGPVFRKGHAYQTSDTINPPLAHYFWLRPQGHRAGLPKNTPFPFSCPRIPTLSHDDWWRHHSRINPLCWGEKGVVGIGDNGVSNQCCATNGRIYFRYVSKSGLEVIQHDGVQGYRASYVSWISCDAHRWPNKPVFIKLMFLQISAAIVCLFLGETILGKT